MEGMNPYILYIGSICYGLENGDSLQATLNRFIKENTHVGFAKQLATLRAQTSIGQPIETILNSCQFDTERALLELTSVGLTGEPVLEHFLELEKEVKWRWEQSIEEHIRLLPVKMSLPLLLLMFPAFLILLFGPILKQLFQGLAQT